MGSCKAAVTFKVHSTYDGFINSKEQGFVGNLFRYYGLAVISKFLYENGTYYYRFIKHPDYTIKDFNGESEWYTLEVEWQEHVDNSGDGWKTMSSDSVFRSGVTYRPKIKVIPKGDYRVKFKNAYINGEKENVSCSYLSENITAYYKEMMPEDTYYSIYVGMVQVGEGNRHDVLGDGGSVQYLLKGECNDKYLIDRDVLVLNNMNLGTLKYHGGGTATITATLSNGLKATCTVTVNAKAEEPPIEFESGKGDVNLDSKVNAIDGNMMSKIILGEVAITEKQEWAADINDDTKINAIDASMLMMLIVQS